MFHDRPAKTVVKVTVGTTRCAVAPQTAHPHPTLRRTPRSVGADVVTG